MAVTIIQQAKGFVTSTAAGTFTTPLPSAPSATRLVLSVASVNKGATSLAPSAPYTERQEYLGSLPSVHGALADAAGSQTCTWTKGAAQNSGGQVAWGSFETSLAGATYRASAKFPNPANDTNAASLAAAAGVGTITVPGVVFAVLGVDSAWAADFVAGGAFAGSANITWTNGYTTLAVVQTDSTTGDTVGGAAFALAYKEVVAGSTTDTTASWTNNDQAYIILSLYDIAVAASGPTTRGQHFPFLAHHQQETPGELWKPECKEIIRPPRRGRRIIDLATLKG